MKIDNRKSSSTYLIRTKTVYIQHITGTQMAWHTQTIAALEANNTVLTVYSGTVIVLKPFILQ